MKTKLLLACLAVVIAAIAYADLVEVHATGSWVPEGKVRGTERSVDRATILKRFDSNDSTGLPFNLRRLGVNP
jgi:hypothetical protein